MKAIKRCSTKGCGHLLGYDLPGGRALCWLHAERQKLPAHVQWRAQFEVWLRGNANDLTRAMTKRDNYGVLGR